MDEIIDQIVRDFFRTTVAVHQRRCAIKQGIRETDKVNCNHDWCPVKSWCIICGQTREALYRGYL